MPKACLSSQTTIYFLNYHFVWCPKHRHMRNGNKRRRGKCEFMSVPSHPKASFRNRLDNGEFLSLTVWAGKSDPQAEVITVADASSQRRRLGDSGRWLLTEPLMAIIPNFPNEEHGNPEDENPDQLLELKPATKKTPNRTNR